MAERTALPRPRRSLPKQAAEFIAWLPGEREAIATIKALGAQYGYGNLIHHLRDAWSEELRRTEGYKRSQADLCAGHICPWCNTDSRTGQKAEKKKEIHD